MKMLNVDDFIDDWFKAGRNINCKFFSGPGFWFCVYGLVWLDDLWFTITSLSLPECKWHALLSFIEFMVILFVKSLKRPLSLHTALIRFLVRKS